MALSLVGYDEEDSNDDEDEEEVVVGGGAVTGALLMPAIAGGLPSDGSESESEEEPQAYAPATASTAASTSSAEPANDAEEVSLLPSIDEAFDAADDASFLSAHQNGIGPDYGGADEPVDAQQAPPAPSAPAEARPAKQQRVEPPKSDVPARKQETTREKNKRKQKLGQANFSLKWDRDCGAELAP